MNKELLKKFQLEAGGSHYPDVNKEMQLSFARQIVDECISAVRDADVRKFVYTTHDQGMAEAVIQRCVHSIEERFNHDAIPAKRKPSTIAPVGGSRL